MEKCKCGAMMTINKIIKDTVSIKPLISTGFSVLMPNQPMFHVPYNVFYNHTHWQQNLLIRCHAHCGYEPIYLKFVTI